MTQFLHSRTHDVPGCTGSWQLEALENLWLWRCAKCRAVDFGSLRDGVPDEVGSVPDGAAHQDWPA